MGKCSLNGSNKITYINTLKTGQQLKNQAIIFFLLKIHFFFNENESRLGLWGKGLIASIFKFIFLSLYNISNHVLLILLNLNN